MKLNLLKNKTPKVYKNKKLNNANFNDYNLNEYQVFLHLVTKVGGVDEIGKYLQPENLQRIYTLEATEFAEIFQLDVKHVYKILTVACKKLMKTSITLERPDLFSTYEINVCSMAEYNHKKGSITIEFTDRIMPYLAQAKQRFVLYNLKEIANFGSLYTTRLYELIQEFKDTGHVIKSVVQLRDIFAVGSQYVKYNDFKRKTFAHAVEEINSQFDIMLSFTEIKDGRKVVAVKFDFIPTYILRGVDRTGKPKNTYIKPKRKKVTEIDKSKENLTQTELSL